MGVVAFVCYWHTLLPGLDFGDTASFQTGVGSLTLTPRQAYPLYYALGNIVAWLDPHEPAHAMNLASAIYGALAAAVAVWVAAELTGTVVGGVAAGLFLAFSYTFWTQAIIAEVYTLHLLIVGLCLVALLAWERKPTPGRLAIFYAFYALGFGNHLSMILLLPGLALFILLARPKGGGDPLRPRAIAMAFGIALLAALQYTWNFRGLWVEDPPPSSLIEAFGKFWFDVTKADWRQTLVMNVSEAGLQHRPALYWFDLHQQFGVPGVLLGMVGFIFLVFRSWRIGVLLLLLYASNLVFAWTYNVGDVHVFFLPSHYVVALCAGAGVAALKKGGGTRPLFRIGVATTCLVYAVWRGYDTFPAVDRSWDRRPEQILDRFTSVPTVPDLYEPKAIFGVDANWQIQNAFEYFMRERKPEVPWFTSDDLSWLNSGNITERWQRLVDANLRVGREVIVTPALARRLESLGYEGGTEEIRAGFSLPRDEETLASELAALRPGTAYVLAILRPYPEYPIDQDDVWRSWLILADHRQLPQLSDYSIIVGKVGREPILVKAQERPFRTHLTVDSGDLDIRMESWLPTDTIRRAGFGHVIVNRRHILTIDRGISFVALDPSNHPTLVAYRNSIFKNIPRFRLGRPGRG